jgi:hypothetical protein
MKAFPEAACREITTHSLVPACTNGRVTSPADVCEVRCEHGERGRDDQVVMAASRLQSEPALRARLKDELS